MLKLSKEQQDILNQVSRRKGVNQEVLLLTVMLQLYRDTFRKEYRL